MSSAGEYYPQAPVPSEHEAFLGAIGHNELFTLGEKVLKRHTPWKEAMRQERYARERIIDEISLYLPPLESPPYDPEAGPTDHINRIRQFNLSTSIPYNAAAMRQESQHTGDLAYRYVSQNHADIRQSIGSGEYRSTDELADFFRFNLRGIIQSPRMHARTILEARRFKAIRQHLPGMLRGSNGIKYYARFLGTTRVQVEEAKQAVFALRSTSPFPDFFHMQPNQQDDIVAALGAEWQQLCKLVDRYDPQALNIQALRTGGPLSYHSFAKLKESINQNELIAPNTICRLFLRNPREFEAKLYAASLAAEGKRRVQAHREVGARRTELEPTSEVVETVAISENMLELQRLTNDPDVNDAILDAAFGEEVHLAKPGELIIGRRFDDIVTKHTHLIGRAIWQLMPDRNKKGVLIDQRSKFSVGTALRGKHNGYMQNLTVTRVPVTIEEMKNELKSFNPETMSPENAVRLIFLAEIKPTGRKPEPTYLSMILTITRSPKGSDVIQMNKNAARANGADVAVSLRMDSEARARAVEVGAWKAPALRTGLPSLGRGGEKSTQQKR